MMPKDLQEADLKINKDPKHLQALFDQDSQRMANFKDWPDRDIKSIQVSTMILIGDQDIILPEHAVKMYRLLRDRQRECPRSLRVL